MAKNDEPRKQIEDNRQNYIDELVKILLNDPDADDFTLEHTQIRQYLVEATKKDGCLLEALEFALEMYLEK